MAKTYDIKIIKPDNITYKELLLALKENLGGEAEEVRVRGAFGTSVLASRVELK